jgi:chromate transporter
LKYGEEAMSNNKRGNSMRFLLEIYVTFLKLGTFGFGGGFALVNLMEKEIVEEKKWMEKEKLIDVFGISQCLPGAIALNSSGFVGYSIAKVPGAMAAILGNITSPVIIVLTMSILFQKFSSYAVVQHAFNGIRPAIIGLIVFAAYNVGKTSLKDGICVAISLAAFIGVLFLKLHPILLIIMGAVAGVGITNIKELLRYKAASKISEEGIK